MAMKGVTPRRGKDGQTYYILNYHVVLLFGMTEFKAQLCWKENVSQNLGFLIWNKN